MVVNNNTRVNWAQPFSFILYGLEWNGISFSILYPSLYQFLVYQSTVIHFVTGLIGKELLLLSYPVADRKLKRQQLGELMLVEYSGALILCPDNELAGTYRNIPPISFLSQGPFRTRRL
jgi:hypothetical protein